MSFGRVFRARWQVRGAHVHVRIFMGKRGSTFALCGELVMTEEEFTVFYKAATGATFQFLPEKARSR
jgi:hypothetical protein